MKKLRTRYVKNNAAKIIEACFFAAMTTTVIYLSITLSDTCHEVPIDTEDNKIPQGIKEIYENKQWNCEENQYNPLASLFFNSEGGTIRSLFQDKKYFIIDWQYLLLFASVWYIFTITTYGVWVPAGLFLPGIIIGSAVGNLYTEGVQYLFGYQNTGEF